VTRVALIVLAKAPVPGRVKTRLCPPCTPEQAARIAAAALADTLEAAAATPGAEPVLVLEGLPEPSAAGLRVLPQRGRGLDERLAAAFQDVGGPALLIGMDTPQVTPELLGTSIDLLMARGVDAVLGPCNDGGWWAIGLRRPDPRAFARVPMSQSWTGLAQRGRLRSLGLAIRSLPRRRDVDLFDDARAVALACPHTRFARAVEDVVAVDKQDAPIPRAVGELA
jgi:rSAM/selenodomain-associated transferase 1